MNKDTSELTTEQLAAMNLYEIYTGWMGCSYGRIYVWATNEVEAMVLAEQSWKRSHPKGEEWHPVLTFLFNAARSPFATQPDDEGFEMWDKPKGGTG